MTLLLCQQDSTYLAPKCAGNCFCITRVSRRRRGAQRPKPMHQWTWDLRCAASSSGMFIVPPPPSPPDTCWNRGGGRGGGLDQGPGGLTLLRCQLDSTYLPLKAPDLLLHHQSPDLADPPPRQQRSQCRGKPKAIKCVATSMSTIRQCQFMTVQFHRGMQFNVNS